MICISDSSSDAYIQGKIQPQYPPRSQFTSNGEFDERRYLFLVRAITWETAHKDITQQKSKNVLASKFKITGVSYDKNRDCKNFFRDDTPPEIKALAHDLTDPNEPALGYRFTVCEQAGVCLQDQARGFHWTTIKQSATRA